MAVAPNTVVTTGISILLKMVVVEEVTGLFDMAGHFGGDKLALRQSQKNTPFEVFADKWENPI
jgi:hypothetical protein